MQSIAKMTKIEQAYLLYEGGFFVKDIAPVLEISPRTVRGYIYRTRHPEKYASRVQAYVRKHRGKSKVPEQHKKPSDKEEAIKRVVELKRRKHKVSVAAPKVQTKNIRAEIAAIITKAGTKGRVKVGQKS